MFSPVLAKFLSGENLDPSRMPYPSAFQRPHKKHSKGSCIHLSKEPLFPPFFNLFLRPIFYKTYQSIQKETRAFFRDF
ncbi:hypothetical protein HQ45_08670 [Porphyromonas crevioricanis]|nr:hypothetical protein HQ45_08670 [Porphyromonas crevioricanis]